LRAVPRVPALDVVAEPLVERGVDRVLARERAGELLARLSIPERLWKLPPATFSGGEQQRVNIARGFIIERPLLLLDEPTASLDARNRGVVIDLIRESMGHGTGMLAIFHDADVREAVADLTVDVQSFTAVCDEVLA
jgi:alpha-D-ribose 1-methylphosphonate 5-triphosphate synthase subunit PhnL